MPTLSATDFNPFNPEFAVNPYPTYARLREIGVARSELGFWVLSRYADVDAAIRDARMGKSLEASPAPWMNEAEPTQLERQMRLQMDMQDGPGHSRLRRLVTQAFTPRQIQQMMPSIENHTAEVISQIKVGEGFDFVQRIALPIPLRFISQLLGLPASDDYLCHELTSPMMAMLDPAQTEESVRIMNSAAEEFHAYLGPHISRRRHTPGDDLMTALIEAGDATDKLSDEEIAATITHLFIAGHETSAGLLANGMNLLMDFPGQWEAIRKDSSLLDGTVEEVLRYESPAQMTRRVTTTSAVELGGIEIPQGERLVPLLASANRDPAVFDQPDRFDVTRRRGKLVSFGGGAHYCLGAAFARLEAKHIFGRLASADIRLVKAGDPRWKRSMLLREIESLPVKVEAA